MRKAANRSGAHTKRKHKAQHGRKAVTRLDSARSERRYARFGAHEGQQRAKSLKERWDAPIGASHLSLDLKHWPMLEINLIDSKSTVALSGKCPFCNDCHHVPRGGADAHSFSRKMPFSVTGSTIDGPRITLTVENSRFLHNSKH